MVVTATPLIQQEPHHFPRGAKPSPRYKLCAAPSFRAAFAPPPQVAWVPKKLSYFGNDRMGDCVSAEEGFAKYCYGLDGQGGGKENGLYSIDDNTVISWAQRHGYANGADLSSVLQSMSQSGFQVGSQLYNDGPYHTVDYATESVLQAALAQGPVKIAIGAGALPSGAGSKQGWYALGGHDGNTDHCVALAGFGPAGYLYDQLQVSLPSALTASQPGYLLFTWSTIGFVDHAWIMGTCVEAWIRNPTTVGQPPLTPPVPPTPPAPTVTLPGTLPFGQYTFGDPKAPSGMIYLPNDLGAGSYPVNVPTPPTPAS